MNDTYALNTPYWPLELYFKY